VHNAPKTIKCDQNDDKPIKEWLVALEWEKAGSDNHENKCLDEKRSWLYAARSQAGLLKETAKIKRF
jgi:hypothetical protein